MDSFFWDGMVETAKKGLMEVDKNAESVQKMITLSSMKFTKTTRHTWECV